MGTVQLLQASEPDVYLVGPELGSIQEQNTNTREITVLIAEDHQLTRMGLKMALQELSHITVVGEAKNGREAVKLAYLHLPDIILMDISMPKLDGIAATREIKQMLPEVKVIILTNHEEGPEVSEAMSAGADSYCTKAIESRRLSWLLNQVMAGVVWLSPSVSQHSSD